MRNRIEKILAIALLPALLLSSAAYMYRHAPVDRSELDTIYLLLPDNIEPDNSMVNEWLDAAEEEGLHLALIHDSEFLNPMREQGMIQGLIVPDLIHRTANGILIGALHDFVHRGGNLMVVYDACTWDLDNNYANVRSRLSDLVGVSYAMYDHLRTDSIYWSEVWGDSRSMLDLEVPPGKYVPATSGAPYYAVKQISAKATPDEFTPGNGDFLLSRYEYGDLKYPAFRTSPDFDGTVLLKSRAGLAAGVRRDGGGHVMFVNIPLGYLESRTDGMLMHSFLRYFGVHLLSVPYLSSVPDGIGGLILNWHIDAKAMVGPLQKLIDAGVFNHGPFSVDLTAGPDVDHFDDGKGLNIGASPQADSLIKQLEERGHAIGSHGGWIHNYFGENVSDTNEKEFSKYLEMNLNSIQKVTGRSVTEYSAPMGNQPQWVSRWLEQRNVKAYYFAGDTGMSPTQVYRDNTKDGTTIWAFPILHLGRYASLEEMGFDSVDPRTVESWLTGVTSFVASERTARLVYTHPLGALRYLPVLQNLLVQTDRLAAQGRFRWYTMAHMADFLNARKRVHWSILQGAEGRAVLKATAPSTLLHQTWILPKSKYGQPRVQDGRADITADDNSWLIRGGDCNEITIEVAQNQRNPR
jgi:peptidoglycan/xylan/chitin deacetylase (PgdA/CDA1 family)